MTTVLEQIHAAFARRGHEGYGEGVSQLDHALQCGMFAQRDGAPLALVAAAFLHDIGHLLHDLPQDIADTGLDTMHSNQKYSNKMRKLTASNNLDSFKV